MHTQQGVDSVNSPECMLAYLFFATLKGSAPTLWGSAGDRMDRSCVGRRGRVEGEGVQREGGGRRGRVEGVQREGGRVEGGQKEGGWRQSINACGTYVEVLCGTVVGF